MSEDNTLRKRRERRPIEQRFWEKVERSEDCWKWQGALNSRGYGWFNAEGTPDRAHRLAWRLAGGEIPPGVMVLHTCDDRTCVRNDDEGWYELNGVLYPRRGHLWLGTNAENVADMIAKSRQSRGERQANAKFSVSDVEEICREYATSSLTQRELAERFGVTSYAIYLIVTGKRWKHVDRAVTHRYQPKLSPDDATEIRSRFAAGGITKTELGREYGVTRTEIYHVIRGVHHRAVEIPTPPQYAIDAVAAMEKGTAPATSSVGVYSIVTDTNDPFSAIPLDILAGSESGANRAEGGDQ